LDWFCDDESIPDDRLNEVLNGRLNVAELAYWRRRVVERAFDPDEAVGEMLWCMFSLRRARKGDVFVAAFGHGLAAMTFVAAYPTYTETMVALKGQGFTSWKDYKERAPSVLSPGIDSP